MKVLKQSVGKIKKDRVLAEYRGTLSQAKQQFMHDAKRMAAKGYFPISEDYQPGSYGCGAFILATLLCLILIGILIFIYMLIVTPPGKLIVVYERNDDSDQEDTKICPECAEMIKAAALVCRFCGHRFNR